MRIKRNGVKQCCGPGSVIIFKDTDPSIIQAKKFRKTLIFSILWLLYDFLSLKNDKYVSSKCKKAKKFENLFFVCISKATGEKSRIWIRKLVVRIRGTGFVPKCHGSSTLTPCQVSVHQLKKKVKKPLQWGGNCGEKVLCFVSTVSLSNYKL